MKYYAGIGSRNTPALIQNKMSLVAEILAQAGYTLRSGGAQGADKAFENGCDRVNGQKEIYLPWKGFEKSTSTLYHLSEKAFQLAAEYHPNFQNLSMGAKKLIARNGYQILGLNLDSPVSLVICWTPSGASVGGTSQALRIAANRNIPVLNYGSMHSWDVLNSVYEMIKREKNV